MTRRTLIAVLALALPVVWAIAHLSFTENDQTEFLGARLGMSARQVRSSFQPVGAWSSTTVDDLLILSWTGEDSRVKSARFELHEGLLVAVRAEVSAASDERAIEADVVREVRDGTLTLIARGCPVHAAEVARIVNN